MKLAVSGKGGVGKTLLSAMLIEAYAARGCSVIAIDADPDANLGLTLGFAGADKITPVAEMKELISERTGAGEAAPYFKISPRVDDIPEKYALKQGNVRLLVMGRPKAGGAGCYCPENALLQTLMAHLLVARDEVVIMDMEAGIEHLGRGTARFVDKLIVVVEPGRKSIDTAHNIQQMAGQLGLKDIVIVGNKVRNQADKDFIISSLPGFNFLGFLPYDQAIVDADQAGVPVLDASKSVIAEARRIYQTLSPAKEPARK